MSVRTWRSGIVWWPSTSTTTPWTTVNTGKSISHPASASTGPRHSFLYAGFQNLSDDKTYNVFNWNIDLRYQFYLKKFFKKKIQLFVYIITSFSWCNLYSFFLISSYYKKGEYEFGCKDVCIQKRTPVLGAYLTIEDHNGMNGTYPCYVAPSQKLWYTTCGQWVVSLLPSHLTLS